MERGARESLARASRPPRRAKVGYHRRREGGSSHPASGDADMAEAEDANGR
jgi:hypothetical protein